MNGMNGSAHPPEVGQRVGALYAHDVRAMS